MIDIHVGVILIGCGSVCQTILSDSPVNDIVACFGRTGTGGIKCHVICIVKEGNIVGGGRKRQYIRR